jgi:hypothetical protein
MAAFPSYAVLIFPGFAIKRPSAVNRSSTESGFVKQAKVKSRVLVPRAVVYQLNSAADYASFLDWFHDDVNYGASWFDWTDPGDGAVKAGRIVNGQIDEVPQRKNFDRWQIKMSIETWSA